MGKKKKRQTVCQTSATYIVRWKLLVEQNNSYLAKANRSNVIQRV